jgi:two-component system OmpR family response regulator
MRVMPQTTVVAVVEDDPEIRALIGGLLSREGFEVVGCPSGEMLDRAMARRRVDLVVLDLMMPGEDGLSICRRLRAGPLDVPRRTRDAHRPAVTAPAETYRFAGWTLDAGSRRLENAAGEAVELTGGEFDLLLVFLTHAQRVLNREQLLDWTRGRSAAPFDRTIDVQLSRLRRKLGDDGASIIRTVRGGGYMFSPALDRG